jgi:rhodanese-related sulfurtransferase
MTIAMHQLREIDASTLKHWIDKHEVLLIDVREPKEFAQEHISGAELMPLSAFEPDQIPRSSDQQVVLQCKSGRRSAKAAERMFKAGFTVVTHLKNGLLAWKAAGYPTEGHSSSLTCSQRLTSVVLGSLLLLSGGLGPLMPPWTLFFSVLIGGSLMLVGLTDRQNA